MITENKLSDVIEIINIENITLHSMKIFAKMNRVGELRISNRFFVSSSVSFFIFGLIISSSFKLFNFYPFVSVT